MDILKEYVANSMKVAAHRIARDLEVDRLLPENDDVDVIDVSPLVTRLRVKFNVTGHGPRYFDITLKESL